MSDRTEKAQTRRRDWRAKWRCPHSNLFGIYGDAINHLGARLRCHDCGRLLDGPVALADLRKDEPR